MLGPGLVTETISLNMKGGLVQPKNSPPVFKPIAARMPLPETNKHDRLNMVGSKMIVSSFQNGAILGPFLLGGGGRCLLVLGKVIHSIYHLERIGWQHKMYSVQGGNVG